MDVRENAEQTFGPWDGLNELGSGPETVVRCLNVDFEDGRVRRRPGRQILATLRAGVPVTGLFQHVGLEGDRVLLAGFTPANGDAPAFGTVDSVFTEVPLPAAGAVPDRWRRFLFASFKGHTIVADPFGRLIDYDGSAAELLQALQGNDAASGLAGAASYLVTPPPASALAVRRNRLVAGDKRTLGLTAYSGDPKVPVNARAGAANVWPGRNNLDVLTRDGDKIIATTVLDDELVVLTRRGVAVVNEDELLPTVRVRRVNGCLAPASVQEVSIPGGASFLIYLSDGKICAWDGGSSSDISLPISRTLRLVNWSAASGAVSAHLVKRNEYRLWLPTNGELGNRLCVIFNYVKKTWKVYAGWFPWDTNARQDMQSPMDVTAAATVLTAGDEEVLITGDSQGRLWLEDTGETDAGSMFPAFFSPGPLLFGERPVTFKDWRLDVTYDGSFVEGIALYDGTPLEHEFDRLQNGLPVKDQRSVARALQGASYAGAGAAYPLSTHGEKADAVKLSFHKRARKMQPVISLPGRDGGVDDPAPGGVRQVEFSLEPRAGGR